MKYTRILPIVAVLAVVGPLAAAGRDGQVVADAAAPESADDIAGVHRQLGKIAGTLETLVRYQRVDLLLRRIDLADRRLAPRERELSSARGSLRSIDEELGRLQDMLEQMEAREREQIQQGRDPQEVVDPMVRGQIEGEIKRQKQQQEATRLRARELEDDLARARERIEILEEQVGELLDEMDRTSRDRQPRDRR